MYILFFCLRYPCISQKAEYNEEKVYSTAIANARFLYNDRNVVTVGGSDASLMLWEVVDEWVKLYWSVELEQDDYDSYESGWPESSVVSESEQEEVTVRYRQVSSSSSDSMLIISDLPLHQGMNVATPFTLLTSDTSDYSEV